MDATRRWFRTGNFANCVVALAAILFCGCTSLASGSDVNPVDPIWGCLGQPPVLPPALDPAPKYVLYNVAVFDFVKRPPAAIPNLTVQVCQIGDYDCSSPRPPGVAMGPSDYATTLNGAMVTVPLYTIAIGYGAEAYLRLTSPGYLQTEYYLGGPLFGSLDGAIMPDSGYPIVSALPIAPIATADAANLEIGVTGQSHVLDDAIIAMRTLDCRNQSASGVTLTLSVEGVPFTFLTGLPSSLTDQSQATDSRGLAGFANIQVSGKLGNVSVEGVAPNGMRYGKINVTVRAGQVTTGDIRPDAGSSGF